MIRYYMDNDYQLNKYIILGVLAMKKVKVIIIHVDTPYTFGLVANKYIVST